MCHEIGDKFGSEKLGNESFPLESFWGDVGGYLSLKDTGDHGVRQ